jgi:putative membrane protein
MRLPVIAVTAAGLLASAAAAQIGNPGFMSADTRFEEPGKPAPHQTNNTDRLFARLAAAGGMAEVAFGELAGSKASAQSVKDFAAMMVEDHTAANEKLAALADAANIPLPEDLDPAHQRMREALEAAEGAAFDATYIAGQIADHQQTVAILVWEMGQGQDAELQRFAAETLPVVTQHLDRAQAIHAELTGAD